MTELSESVACALDSAAQRLLGGKDVAVAFSGGIDSGIVAALAVKYAKNVRLYTAGTSGSHHIEAALATAPLIGADIETIEIHDSDITDYLREVMAITGTDSPLTLAFEMPLFCVMKTCKEDSVTGGQGSDEQFAGYSKYVGKQDIQLREEMVKDMAKLYKETLPHEKKVAEHFGKEIAYPYLDKDLVAILRSAPTEAIRPVDQDVRKKLLSDAARDLGLGYLADRPKKAAQYGSGMMDAVKRICRKRGITYNKLVADLRKEMDGYSRM